VRAINGRQVLHTMDFSLVTPRWQRFTVLGLVVLTTVVFWTPAPDAFGLPKATVLWIGTLALIALGAARVLWERTIRLPRSPWAIAVAALVVAVVVTTLASPTLALSVVGEYNRYTGLLSYVSFAIVGLVVIRTFDVDEAALLLRVLTVLLGVVGAYGLLQVLDLDPYEFGVEDIGTVGTMGNANIFAGFLAIAVPAATWQALSETSSHRWRVAGAAAAILGLVVAVGTRSFQGPAAAVPGALVVIGLWSTTEGGRRRRQWALERAGPARRLLPAALILVAIGALGLAVLAVREGLADGLLERGDFWRAALRMFNDSPLLGSGFDTYGQHFLADRPAGHAIRFGSTHAESAHSVPLNLLAGGGLVVFLPWLAVVATTALALARGVRRLEGEERLLLAGVGGCWVAYLVQATVSFDVPTLGLLHFVLAGVIVAIGAPPHWVERAIPGPVPRAVGRRGSQRYAFPGQTWMAMAAVAVLVIGGAWLATRPLRADLAAARAQDQADAGDAAAATNSLARATELAPWQGRYWLLRAQLAEASQEVFAAVTFAEAAARREPGSAEYALLAGRLNERYRDADAARPWFEEALDRDPHNPRIYRALVSYELASGNIAAGVAWLSRLEAAGVPVDGQAMVELGMAYQSAGDLEQAAMSFDEGIELGASGIELYRQRALLEAEIGEPARAVEFMRTATAGQALLDYWLELGLLLEEIDLRQSAASYDHAIRSGAPTVEILYRRALVEVQIGAGHRAVEILRTPTNAGSPTDEWYQLGRALEAAGDRAAARLAYAEALAIEPGNAEYQAAHDRLAGA